MTEDPLDLSLLDGMAEIMTLAQDREWRLNNIYLIVDRNGKMQPWDPYPWQKRYRRERHTLNMLPKARQKGMSLQLVIENGDECVWTENMTAGIIDLKEDHAWAKLDKFRFAWKNGPLYDWPDPRIKRLWEVIHVMNPLVTDQVGKMVWANGASFVASTNFTGQSPQRLHWSEAGPLSAQRPATARKILRGALNSLSQYSIIDVETTLEGPRVGVAFQILEQAIACRNAKHLRNTQWKLHFINWQGVPEYRNPGCKPQLESTRKYFAELEKLGQHYDDEEQSWWEDKKATLKGEMTQQFPCTLDEAMSFDGDRPRFQRSALGFLDSLIADAVPAEFGVLDQQRDERPTFSETDEESSWFRLWEEPKEGFKYLLSADFCGKDEEDDDRPELDKHAVVILRAPAMTVRDGEKVLLPMAVVAAIRTDDRAPLDVLARRIYLMSYFYGHCCVVPEINKHLGYCAQLRAAGVRDIWRRRVHVDDPGRGTGKTDYKTGWETTSSSKPLIIEGLDKVMREQELLTWCPRIVGELRTFQQSNNALMGQHDDWVMALAIGVHAIGSATLYRKQIPVVASPVQMPGYQQPGAGGFQRGWEE
jgi:hypothetical protein